MNFETTETPEAMTFMIKGEITSSSTINLENVLNDFVDNDKRNIIIDLKGVDRIDSLSLAVFIGCKNRLTKTGRTLKLINPNEYITRVIELASLEFFLLEE